MIKARQRPDFALINVIVKEMLKSPDPNQESVVCPKCGQNKGVKGYTIGGDTIEYYCVRCGRFVMKNGGEKNVEIQKI